MGTLYKAKFEIIPFESTTWDQNWGQTIWKFSVEVDKTYVGGKWKNMLRAKLAKMEGRGSVGKTSIVGVKVRATNWVKAKVLANTKGETMSRFVLEHVTPGTALYTDDARAYSGLRNHESVKHSIMEYQKGRRLLARLPN